MPLSENLKDQFAKMVNADNPKENTDNTVYGTVKVYSDGTKAVVLDGSNIATPFETVTDAEDGDRVTVTIRNHKAVVTGNLSSPAARTDAVKTNSEKIGEFNTVLSNKVGTDELDAQVGRINTLESDNATIKQKLAASEGEFKEIKTKQLEVEEKVTAAEAEIKTIKSDKIDATVVESEYTKTKVFDALAGTVGTLNGDFSNFKNTTTEKLDAHKADIDELNTKKLNSEDADLKFANINFTNIGKAAMEYFYAQSGLIKNVVVGDQTITGELIGVTIKGDLIEGNTVVADKLVIKGEDGLYYKLNTDGITTEIEQTDYNSINGQVIRAKSVTASKIDVKDLVAFDATIAGFKIDDNAIHSIGKESATSGVRGIYLGKDGQMAVGDSNHYIKYYKDTDGSFKLAISAESMEFSSGTSVKDAIDDVNNKVNNIKSIKNTTVTYQVGDSNTKAPTGTWSPNIPSVTVGKYLWTRTVFTYSDNTISTSYGISSMGAKGDQGIPGTNGQNGKSIGSVINYYLATNANTGVTASTSGWTTTVQSVSTSKKYLWNYEIVKYTDGTIASTTAPCVIGSYGDTGATGKGVKSTAITYQAAANGTTVPTGTWVASPPTTTSALPYMWTRTIITYTDNTISTSYSIGSTPEGIQVGGRNLLTGSAGWTKANPAKSTNAPDGYVYIGGRAYLENGKTYTLQAVSDSVWATGHGGQTGKATIWIHGLLGDDFHRVFCGDGITSGRYTWTFVHTSATQNCEIRINGYSKITSFWDIKIESGNKATDWTPAPEDIDYAISDVNSKITKTKEEITQSVSKTYQTKNDMGNYYTTKQTDAAIKTRCDNVELKVDGIKIGGRNLAQKTSSKYYVSFSKFNGNDNVCFSIGNTLTDGLSVGDIISIKLVCKYTNIASVSGKTPQVRIIGAGNVTGWNDNGYFPVNNFTKLSGSNGEVTIIYQATINENHVKNSYWNTLLRTDAIQSGTIQCKMFKVERGTRYTDWTPAPEDVDSAINDVSESTNQYITDVSDSLGKTEEELADLKSNTNATLKLCVKEDETGRLKSMIEAIADTINITAKGGLNLTGNRFSVSSTNLTITKDGSMTCKKIVATGGTVGGWQIQSDGLYSMSGEQGSSLSLMNLGNFKGSSEDDLIISFRRWNTYPFYVTSGGELGCRKLAISVGYNKLNQRATTSANDTQAFNYAWTINGTGLFILNAGLWTDTTDDYGTTNCAIYVNGACVTSNTHRYGENSSSVELDAGATFVYWFRNANNQKVLLQAGSTKTGNKTLTYTVQGLFGLAVT